MAEGAVRVADIAAGGGEEQGRVRVGVGGKAAPRNGKVAQVGLQRRLQLEDGAASGTATVSDPGPVQGSRRRRRSNGAVQAELADVLGGTGHGAPAGQNQSVAAERTRRDSGESAAALSVPGDGVLATGVITHSNVRNLGDNKTIKHNK